MGDRASDDQRLALVAASAWAAVVRAKFGGALVRFDKGGGDFATEADIAAERAILDVLRTARPADAILGEEGGRSGANRRNECGWLIRCAAR